MHENLMTVTQAANRLGIKPNSLRQRIKAGSIKAIRIGCACLIDSSEVERYADDSLGKPGRKKSKKV